MQVSGAGIALAVLRGQQEGVLAPPPEAKDVSGNVDFPQLQFSDPEHQDIPKHETLEFKMLQAEMGRMMEAKVKLRDGSASPFDTESACYMGGYNAWSLWNEDPRMIFEGNFSVSDFGLMGETAPQRDADFPSRRDAMAFAYHFATKMSGYAKAVVGQKPVIEAYSDTLLDASGRLHGISDSGQMLGNRASRDSAMAHGTYDFILERTNLERSAASLANLFSFDSSSVTLAAYEGEFKGFSITHGELGKIMDVTEDGSITLYGADGTAYTAAEYNAANIDGGIPQLHNDMIRQADKLKS